VVRVRPNALPLSRLARGGAGRLIIGQGGAADAQYKLLVGDAELSAVSFHGRFSSALRKALGWAGGGG
jgi:hypothetical protein